MVKRKSLCFFLAAVAMHSQAEHWNNATVTTTSASHANPSMTQGRAGQPNLAPATRPKYNEASAIYVVGQAIALNTPRNLAKPASQFQIQPALPLGLHLDPNTGAISGTPTTATVPTVYTVTARHADALLTLKLRITVVTAQSWLPTGRMVAPRSQHTLTVLKDGRVLALGGVDNAKSVTLASAEIFHPSTGQWRTVAPMHVPRLAATANLLDDGRVLVVGGSSAGQPSAELYDPTTNTWTLAAEMNTNRSYHKAVRLNNGKVWVSGGVQNLGFVSTVMTLFGWSSPVLASTEMYDPKTNTWTLTAALHTARAGHALTQLPDNRLLLSGGLNTRFDSLAAAEIYDPVTNTCQSIAPMKQARQVHSAALLPTGKVLVSGGVTKVAQGMTVLALSEIYDPATNRWQDAAPLNDARMAAAEVPLSDGKLMLLGGEDTSALHPLSSAEIYDPMRNTWRRVADMGEARKAQAAVLLNNGDVLVAGGEARNHASLPSAERFILTR